VGVIDSRTTGIFNIDSFSDFQINCRSRAWVSKFLTPIHDQGTSGDLEWQKVLDVVLLGWKTDLNEYENHTDLCNRVSPTEGLLKRSTWLTKVGYLLPIVADLAMLQTHLGKEIKLSSLTMCRPHSSSEKSSQVILTIFGPVYVYGVMDSEFIQDRNPPAETFLLV
jgi:hypothetical protein